MLLSRFVTAVVFAFNGSSVESALGRRFRPGYRGEPCLHRVGATKQLFVLPPAAERAGGLVVPLSFNRLHCTDDQGATVRSSDPPNVAAVNGDSLTYKPRLRSCVCEFVCAWLSEPLAVTRLDVLFYLSNSPNGEVSVDFGAQH